VTIGRVVLYIVRAFGGEINIPLGLRSRIKKNNYALKFLIDLVASGRVVLYIARAFAGEINIPLGRRLGIELLKVTCVKFYARIVNLRYLLFCMIFYSLLVRLCPLFSFFLPLFYYLFFDPMSKIHRVFLNLLKYISLYTGVS